MLVGIGLPSSIPGAGARLSLEWARRAEAGPFASLGVVDRMRYDSHEPMTVLSAVAAVTSRIGLVTMVVIGPLRRTPIFAREAAAIQRISEGRLALGLAVGARTDDYDALGERHEGRGLRLEDQLADLRDNFEELTTAPALLVGGGSDISLVRAARYADGYVHGEDHRGLFKRVGRPGYHRVDRGGSPRPPEAVGAGILRAR